MNTEYVKKRTNQMIGYENFERKEKVRLKKIKNFIIVFGIFTILLGGSVTVNAMTDNGIVNKVKDVLHMNVKINGEEKNATCKKSEEGIIKCSIDKEVLGNQANFEFDVDENYLDDIEIETNIQEDESEINATIHAK